MPDWAQGDMDMDDQKKPAPVAEKKAPEEDDNEETANPLAGVGGYEQGEDADE